MSAKYVAINAQGREVPVQFFATVLAIPSRIGFVMGHTYAVSMDAVAMSGHTLRTSAPQYIAKFRDARRAAEEICREQGCGYRYISAGGAA